MPRRLQPVYSSVGVFVVLPGKAISRVVCPSQVWEACVSLPPAAGMRHVMAGRQAWLVLLPLLRELTTNGSSSLSSIMLNIELSGLLAHCTV